MKDLIRNSLVIKIAIVIAILYIIPMCLLTLHKKGIISEYEYEIHWIDGKPCAYIQKYTGSSNTVKIPNKLLFFSVKSIDPYAYKYNSSITKVIIPKDYRELLFFDENEILTSVEYEEGTVDLNGSFINCKNLKEIIIPESARTNKAMFTGCESLNDVSFPDQMKMVYGSAFDGTAFKAKHENDKYYVVGDGVLLFYNGKETDIVIPKGVKYVTGEMNPDDENISFYFPDTLKGIYVNLPEGSTSYFYDSDINIEGTGWNKFKGEVVATKDSSIDTYSQQYSFKYREMTSEEEAICREKTEAAANDIKYQE